ncbi:hypothetical protein ILUMI_05706 [Ignelater luminosus]|uniref:Uncharacterized protein n=1 Tax=Ignelater luminosus TaxID=2038154 RepID=A0A8K0GDB3_IGNLU|nr:hypothetical protein ILUMI_05706 [Ignelater luminosus]
MFIYLLIVITLYVQGNTAQECNYNANKFTEISCSYMTSLEEIRNKINDTLNQYGPVERLIEYLELQNCELTNLTLYSLRFFPNLKEIYIIDSKISKLSCEEDLTTNSMNRGETTNDDEETNEFQGQTDESVTSNTHIRHLYTRTQTTHYITTTLQLSFEEMVAVVCPWPKEKQSGRLPATVGENEPPNDAAAGITRLGHR